MKQFYYYSLITRGNTTEGQRGFWSPMDSERLEDYDLSAEDVFDIKFHKSPCDIENGIVDCSTRKSLT